MKIKIKKKNKKIQFGLIILNQAMTTLHNAMDSISFFFFFFFFFALNTNAIEGLILKRGMLKSELLIENNLFTILKNFIVLFL